MKKPHKHAEVIKAWADGNAIQCKTSNGEWFDVEPYTHAMLFCEELEYRIKPEPVYPVTRMEYEDLDKEYFAYANEHLQEELVAWSSLAARNLANAAIRRAIQDGDVVLPGEKQ